MAPSPLLVGGSGAGTQIIYLVAGGWEERVLSPHVAAVSWVFCLGSAGGGPHALMGEGVSEGFYRRTGPFVRRVGRRGEAEVGRSRDEMYPQGINDFCRGRNPSVGEILKPTQSTPSSELFKT